MHEQNAIKSMPLYVDVERINHELAALGIGVDQVLTPAQLFPFGQYHYHVTDAVHAAAHLLGLGPASHVLDVGSGLGGPVRYLASTTFIAGHNRVRNHCSNDAGIPGRFRYRMTRASDVVYETV